MKQKPKKVLAWGLKSNKKILPYVFITEKELKENVFYKGFKIIRVEIKEVKRAGK